MRILNLKFKNINSLSGENEIDFTNAVFTNDGLFAITGKTGAGKSSILDAISLAFYGKTPRVDITGNENAVMTRGEKDCYSEIIFEVAGKKWKSSWKQERARTGTLKQVERIIADENNKIVADKISIKGDRKNADEKTVNEKIIEILGLTFEQFTKVIMLAQGSFAAFLQADKNDKGELLEQITGTEIYGEISKKVFERNRAEKEKLDKILVELGAIKILSDEEIQNLTNDIAAGESDKRQIDNELEQIELAKKWLVDVANLQKQIDDTKQTLPDLEEKLKMAKSTFEQSEKDLKAAKDEQAKQSPIFIKVRELDTKIAEKENSLTPFATIISDLEKSISELSKTIEKQKNDLEINKKAVVEKQSWATQNVKYQELVGNYAAIENENQLIVDSLKEIDKQNLEIVAYQKELDSKKAIVKSTTAVFDEKEKSLSEKKQALEAKKLELVSILDGKELADYQSDKEIITRFGILIKGLVEVENALAQNHKEIADCNAKIKATEILEINLAKTILNNKEKAQNLENQIKLLEENLLLTRTIQSLDNHRKTLADGKECPLCGSRQHPFAVGNVPQIGEKEIELVTLKKQNKETIDANLNDEKTLQKTNSEKEHAREIITKEEKALSENIEKQKAIVSEIKTVQPDFAMAEDETKLVFIESVRKQKQAQFIQVEAIIKNATQCEKLISELRDKEIPTLQKEKEAAEKSKNEAETAQKLAEQQIKTKQDIATQSQEKQKLENSLFSKKLEIYGVLNIEALKNCLDTWNENSTQIELLATKNSNLSSTISLNNKEIENQTKSKVEKQNEKQAIEIIKQKLVEERKAIFAEKSVEEEDGRFKKWVEDTEAAKTIAEKLKNETNLEWEKNKAIVADKEKELIVKQEQKVTEKSLTELQAELDEKKAKAEEFLKKIGANNESLKLNNDNLKSSGNKIKEKEKQKEICNKWGNLNELIGSGDGKKYRNFAQSLTFEHLIGLSNNQLQKMSDRYILKRTGEVSNPFELSVIDEFQSNEERTVQNLSGGEKFIISLSLALGLANMASKNMRIDTMFIDEGFGTLDADYLDVALTALSNLQNEGKIIGVISHLAELKERIATHIEVIPSGNGHSKIRITN